MEDDSSVETANIDKSYIPVEIFQKPIPMVKLRRQNLNNPSVMIQKQWRELLDPKKPISTKHVRCVASLYLEEIFLRIKPISTGAAGYYRRKETATYLEGYLAPKNQDRRAF